MTVPKPIWLYRIIHIDNLEPCLRRNSLHAPNHWPDDGFAYRTIHNTEIQKLRSAREIECGPGGVVHDYVSFYFGARSPMLYQLHTGWVTDYTEGQEPIVYLVTTVENVAASGAEYVFSDGHGLATFTKWYTDLGDMDCVDWNAVHARAWRDTLEDPDRQRRKQAEFLVHQRCDWTVIKGIGVVSARMKRRVEVILASFDASLARPVKVKPNWYY